MKSVNDISRSTVLRRRIETIKKKNRLQRQSRRADRTYPKRSGNCGKRVYRGRFFRFPVEIDVRDSIQSRLENLFLRPRGVLEFFQFSSIFGLKITNEKPHMRWARRGLVGLNDPSITPPRADVAGGKAQARQRQSLSVDIFN